MKTPKPRWLSTPLLLLMLLAGAPLAQAYYDPGIQRWINRDPISDTGFNRQRRGGTSVPPRAVADNSFVGNNPIMSVDPHGLSPLQDCFDKCRQRSMDDLAKCDRFAFKVACVMGAAGAVLGGTIGGVAGSESGPGGVIIGAGGGAVLVGGINFVGWGTGSWAACAYRAAYREAQCNFACVGEYGW